MADRSKPPGGTLGATRVAMRRSVAARRRVPLVPVRAAGGRGPHPPWSLRGEPRDEISGTTAKPCSSQTPRVDLKDAIIQAFADGFADKPGATFGTMNAVLAEKLPGYVRPKFYAIIRGSKHRA